MPWEDIFKLSASVTAADFCEWAQVGIDVNIPSCKYQVKSHSSPWFSATCAAVIAHVNHFFHLHLLNNSSESIVKFRKDSNCGKRVLKLPNLLAETWLSQILMNC